MIQVGLVGVGPEWNRFRPALSRLRKPIHVEAVYDPVFARAEKAAEELEADFAPGIQSLAERGNVEAILLMDSGLGLTSVLSLLARSGKPVFCVPWQVENSSDSDRLTELSSSGDVRIIPAMWRRFFPAAIRLQELLATELGIPLHISITFARAQSVNVLKQTSIEPFVGWLDFCRNLIRAFPTRASIKSPTESDATGDSILVEYPPVSVPGVDAQVISAPRVMERTALLQVHHSESNPKPSSSGADEQLPEIRVKCLKGEVVILSRDELQWRVESDEWIVEQLTSERTPEEIMLDVFCRRVVGGLIPVASLQDILRPVSLLKSCGVV